MPRVPMHITVDRENTPHLTYTPPTSADFQPVDIVVPPLSVPFPTKEDFLRPDLFAEKPTDEGKFRIESQAKVRESCGNIACRGELSIASAGQLDNPNFRILIGATILCSTIGCPLDNPPMADDNEPLVPSPIPPVLQAHAEPSQAVL